MWGILTAVLIGVFSAFGNLTPTRFIHNPEMSAEPIYNEVGENGSYTEENGWQRNAYATSDPSLNETKESAPTLTEEELNAAAVPIGGVAETTKKENEDGEGPRSMNTLTDE